MLINDPGTALCQRQGGAFGRPADKLANSDVSYGSVRFPREISGRNRKEIDRFRNNLEGLTELFGSLGKLSEGS